MGLIRTLAWGAAGFAAAHVVESMWHRWIAHGKRPDPTRTGHLEHHRVAAEPVDVGREIREHGARFGKTLAGAGLALVPLVGVRRVVAFGAGFALGMVAVNYEHASMHRRAPRTRYEAWMWRFHWHHHAVDARVNFGLTNPLVDFVLGTAVVPAEVTLHPNLAPQWLVERGGSYEGIRIAAPREAADVA